MNITQHELHDKQLNWVVLSSLQRADNIKLYQDYTVYAQQT